MYFFSSGSFVMAFNFCEVDRSMKNIAEHCFRQPYLITVCPATISDNNISYVTTERSNVLNSFNTVNFHKVLYLVFLFVFAGPVAVRNLGIIQRY